MTPALTPCAAASFVCPKSAALCIPARNPNRGSALNIFIHPAEKVTTTSQLNGKSVTHAHRARPILIKTVVAKLNAMTANS